MDLTALVNAVKSAFQVEVDFPELTEEELEVLHPFLVWSSSQVVKKTLEHTTHLVKLEDRLPMRSHIKSRFQQLSVPRLQEMYATDTLFATSYEG